MAPNSTLEQFMQRVEVGPGCWNWKGYKNRKGYGRIRWSGRDLPAHRLSYEFHVGAVPSGLTLDHLCRNTGCVNPRHLEPTTMKANILRGNGWAARNARKETCRYGHPLVVVAWERSRRQCLVCRDIRDSLRDYGLEKRRRALKEPK